MKKKKIIFFTANRAEYGLIYPFIKKLSSNKKLNIKLIVAGSHFNKKFGFSFSEIKKDKVKILSKIQIPLKTNTLTDAAEYLNLIQKKINHILKKNIIDCVFLSSDRFETFAFAISAYLKKIPIIHYEGGDVTEGGALDDNIRHAITKISNLHLTSNMPSMKRIIKMGEEHWRCLNIGYSPIFLLKNMKFNFLEIIKLFDLDTKKPLVLFTLHPIIEKNFNFGLNEVFQALEKLYLHGCQIIITYPNFDPGYKKIIDKIILLKKKFKNIKVIKHLGRIKYLSLLYYIGKSKNGVCLGNSSSGIKEAILFNCPTINIGSRQQSRLKPYNVVDVQTKKNKIFKITLKNLKLKKKGSNPYKLTRSFSNLDSNLIKLLNNKKLNKKKCTI
jgi:UDP-hydrolysing UDP-N-acetyl-D-glucosamine 2-epimerase